MTDQPNHEPVVERRSHRLHRLMWAIKEPHRVERFNRWRKTPRTVTRGFLLFRDLILVGFVAAIVTAGVTTVKHLRQEDCRAMNARRRDVAEIFRDLVANDRNLIEFTDSFTPDGLPDAYKLPLLARYQQQLNDINDAYRFTNCPGADLPEP